MARIGRTHPPQVFRPGAPGSDTAGGTGVFPSSGRMLGVQPPSAVTIPHPPQVTTVLVGRQAVTPRRNLTQRFPLQGWTGHGAIDTLSGASFFTRHESDLSLLSAQGIGVEAGNQRVASSFSMPLGGELTKLVVAVTLNGAPLDDLVCTIEANSAGAPSGVPLTTAVVPATSIPGGGFNDLTVTSFDTRLAFSPGTTYWLVLKRSGAFDAGNFVAVGVFPGGSYAVYNGASWSTLSGSDFSLIVQVQLPDGSRSFYAYKRNLGPKPPLIIRALPTQGMQTVNVDYTKSAVRTRREMPRHFPLQGWDGGTTLGPFGSVPFATPILDTFDRDEVPVSDGGAWVTRSDPSPASYKCAPLQADALNSAVFPTAKDLTVNTHNVAIREGAGQFRDSEWYSTIHTSNTSTTHYVLARVQPGSAGIDAYAVRWDPLGGFMALLRLTSSGGDAVLLSIPGSYFLVDGDKIGIRCIGDLIEVWVQQAPQAWRKLGSTTRTDYDIGYGGISLRTNNVAPLTASFGDFGGGAIIAPTLVSGQPRRLLGPKPPLVALPLASQQMRTVSVRDLTQAIIRREQAQQREPKSLLFPVQTLAQPPPPFFGPSVTLASDLTRRSFRVVSRRAFSRIRRPVVTFDALIVAPIQVTLTPSRRPKPRSVLPQTIVPAAAAQTFSGPQVTLARKRPRVVTTSFLSPPTVLQTFAGPRVESVAIPRSRPQRTIVRQRRPVVTFDALIVEPVRVTSVTARPRRTHSFLTPPIVGAVVQAFYGPTTHLVRARPRRTISLLRAPTVLQTFSSAKAPLVRTRPRKTRWLLLPPATLEPESIQLAERQISVHAVRTRPRATTRFLGKPTALQVFSAGRAMLARTRPRPTTRELLPPAVVEPYLRAPDRRLEIPTPSVRTRPRPTTHRLSPPTVLQFFAAPKTPLIQTRPRKTRWFLAPPATLEPESIQLAERQIRVQLVRTRPRATSRFLRAPTVLQTFGGPQVALAKIKPRPTIAALFPPAVVAQAGQTFDAPSTPLVRIRPARTISRLTSISYPQTSRISATLVRTRPRHTIARLAAPATLEPESIQLAERAIRVVTTRIRPRPTTTALAAPTTLQTFAGPVAHLVHTRPRRTLGLLAAPAAIRIPAVEQREQTITVALARIRPRKTHAFSIIPATLEPEFVQLAERAIGVHLVRTRPRPIRTELAPPAVIRVPSVEQQQQTIATTLARIRPPRTIVRLAPPTTLQEFFGPVETEVAVRTLLEQRRHAPHTRLFPPTVLQTFAGPRVSLARIRPPKTRAVIFPPSEIRIPAVEQREQTIRAVLVQTRPRPTSTALYPPTTLQTFSGPRTLLTRILPRPTTRRIFPPTILLVPSVEAQLRTIQVALVQTRPPATRTALRPPTVIISNPPVVTTITVSIVSQRTRYEHPRHFPLQGWLGVSSEIAPPTPGTPGTPGLVSGLTVVTPGGRRTSVQYKLAGVDIPGTAGTPGDPGIQFALVQPLLGPRRPALILGVQPEPHARPIVTAFSGRTRTELSRRAPNFFLSPPAVVAHEAFFGPAVALVETRPRPTSSTLSPPTVVRVPSVEQQENTIRVTLARIRPRKTFGRIAAPTTLRTFAAPATPLVRTRPAPTIARLAPPTVVAQTRVVDVIGVSLARIRPRRTAHQIAPPTALRVFQGAKVTLARIVPKPTTTRLAPPTVVLVPSVEQAQRTIKVSLARIRPRRTQAISLTPAATPPVVSELRTTLTRIRPRPTIARLQPPAVVLVVAQREQTIRVSLVRIRPARTIARVEPPTEVLPLPGLAQQTIKVKLAVQARLDLPRVHFLLGRPAILVIPLPGVTWGEDIAATAVDDQDVAATTASDEDQVAATAVEGSDSAADVESVAEDVAATTVESEDKEAGT